MIDPISIGVLAGCGLLGMLFERARAKRKARRERLDVIAGYSTELERILQKQADKGAKP